MRILSESIRQFHYSIAVARFFLTILFIIFLVQLAHPQKLLDTDSSHIDYPIIENNNGIIEISINSAWFSIDSCDTSNIEIDGNSLITILSNCRGSLRYVAPEGVERQQLERFTGTDTLEGNFDNGEMILVNKVDPAVISVLDPADLAKLSENDKLNLSEKESNASAGKFILLDVLHDLLSHQPGRFFYGRVRLDDCGDLAFRLNNYDFQVCKYSYYGIKKIADIVNHYRIVPDSLLTDIDNIDITNYEINSKIGNSGNIKVTCRVHYIASSEDNRLLRFEWNGKNKIVSVRDSEGNQLSAVISPDRGTFFSSDADKIEFGVILSSRNTSKEENFIDIVYNCGIFSEYQDNFIPQIVEHVYPLRSESNSEKYDMSNFSVGYFWNMFAEKIRAPWWDNVSGDSIYNLYEEDLYRARLSDEFVEFDIGNPVIDMNDYSAQRIHAKMPDFSPPYANTLLDASVDWYPEPYRRDRAGFKLHFEYPEDLRVVSAGTKLFEDRRDGTAISDWAVTESTADVLFAVGNFECKENARKTLPAIETFISKDFPFDEFEDLYARMGRLSFSDKAGFVSTVASEYCDFFNDRIGKCDIDTLRIVSNSLIGYGCSSRGFITIPWEKFQFEDYNCRSRMFIGHQVAHQWWGETVASAGNKDDWIIEGLSEYCAYWGTKNLCQSSSAINEIFDEMRNASHGGSGVYSSGSRTGSMTLGPRLISSSSEDYYPVVYAKAAYIFHMIRYLLFDYSNNSDKPFSDFLRDLINTYRGKAISTDDLKALLEKHVNSDMTWFFDQWVYGTQIPEYKFEFEAMPATAGKYKIKCLVTRSKAADDFKMIVPLTVLFDDDKFIHLRYWIDKEVNEFESPLLPYKPVKVVFNTYDAVLCR